MALADTAYFAEMKQQIKNLPSKRRVMIFKPTKEEQDIYL